MRKKAKTYPQKVYIEGDVWDALRPLIEWPDGRPIYGAVTKVCNIALRRHLADLGRETLRYHAGDPLQLTDQAPSSVTTTVIGGGGGPEDNPFLELKED